MLRRVATCELPAKYDTCVFAMLPLKRMDLILSSRAWAQEGYFALHIHSNPLVRPTFCPMKIDHKSGLTLYPGYWLV